ADAHSISLDEVTAAGMVAAAARSVTIAGVTIEAGTVGAWQMEVTALRGDVPLFQYRPIWYVTKDLEPGLDVRDSGWHVVVQGDAPLDIDIRFTTEDYATISPGYNAYIAVNAVAPVCQARPGIRTAVDVPRVIANFER